MESCSLPWSSYAGRPLPWWAVHLLNNSAIVVLLACGDHLLLKSWLAARGVAQHQLDNARWFWLHAIANFFVCCTALTSVWATLTDPIGALDGRSHSDLSFFGDASLWPLTIINSVHVYHMIGQFELSGADYFHHLVFVPALGFPGQVYRWGSLGNMMAFFISGLPGGLDYLLLGCQKLGLVDHLFEKQASANLNTWLRVPGILFTSTLLYQATLLGNHASVQEGGPPSWALALQIILPPHAGGHF